MKAVVASVKREWWGKMLAGEKTMEIRKSAPQSKDGRTFTWPFTVLVYVSGTGTIRGKFTCPGWVKTNLLEMLVDQSCVPLENLRAYAKGGSLYGWMIQNAEKFDIPVPLAEVGLTKPPMSWQYVEIPESQDLLEQSDGGN